VTALPITGRFDSVYRSLLVADVHRQLDASLPSVTFPDEEDLAYALSVATGLALSGSGETEESANAARKAYEVAIRSLNFANGSEPAMRAVCDLILSRIGNFPARSLLDEQNGAAEVRDPFLGLEMLVVDMRISFAEPAPRQFSQISKSSSYKRSRQRGLSASRHRHRPENHSP